MLRTILAGALASGALLASGGAHAQDYGYGGGGYGVGVGASFGYDAAPAYATGGGYRYEPYRPHGFTLAGVRAGVTVLGVDIDGSAKLTIGARDWRRGGYAPAPVPYAPPAPQPMYEEPASPPPGYWMGYSAPYNCGCAPPPPPCCTYGGGY